MDIIVMAISEPVLEHSVGIVGSFGPRVHGN
jgi:hypothetical protein